MTGKKIWIINQDVLTPAYGYMQHRHFYIASELQKRGCDVNILTSNYSHFVVNMPPSSKTYNFETINDVKFCWINGLRYSKPNGLKRIFGWLHFTLLLFFVPKKTLNRPEVIIFSSTGLFPLLAAWYYKIRYKTRLIVETRDIWPMTLVEIGNISRRHPLIIVIGWLEKLSYKIADHVVGTMPNLSARIEEVTGHEIPFTCVPQGIDIEFIRQLKPLESAFEEKYLPPGKFIIGYAGTIGTSNALEDLIKAGNILYKSIPELHIVLLGEGSRKKDLQQQCKDLPFFSFAPKIPKTQVNAFLEKCDLLFDGVYPSRIYNYGLSRNKWIDYMFSGRPIVVSYSGFLSMLNDAGCGAAIPVNDIQALVNTILRYYKMDIVQRKAIGNNGKAYILQHRTFDKIGSLYHQIIKEI